ncbi:MAG TPA: anthranilate phosphoribosyltransferase [bacterium]|nr:anthranilate phosphoribosyltransferase [bacterium]
MIQVVLKKLGRGSSLSEEEMVAVMKEIMAGKAAEDDIVQFLTGLRDKGEILAEIKGAVRVLREFMVKVSVNQDNLVDTCGTGGDASGTFNISTAAAFVVAGAGVRVAKHGNRAISSKSGSADILEKLGVRIELEPVQVRKCLVEAGFGFFFAPRFHPAMKNVAGARKRIGTRTIFNLLGPLANPANPLTQVIGVYDAKKMTMMAQVLRDLGSTRVLLVHGEDGLDEITLTGRTYAVALGNGKIGELTIDPEELGLELCKPEDLLGRDADYNAMMLKGVLEGYESPLRTAVMLNAAAALMVSGRASSLEEGLTIAEHSLDQGRAYEVLKDVIRISNE